MIDAFGTQPLGARTFEIAQVNLVIEEELGDGMNLDFLDDSDLPPTGDPSSEMEINENLLQGILEELELDYESKPQGFAPRGAMPTKELERKLELLDSIEELEAENGKIKDENETYFIDLRYHGDVLVFF